MFDPERFAEGKEIPLAYQPFSKGTSRVCTDISSPNMYWFRFRVHGRTDYPRVDAEEI
jgi:hypothetical protein